MRIELGQDFSVSDEGPLAGDMPELRIFGRQNIQWLYVGDRDAGPGIWGDQSLFGRHATQPVESAHPTLITGAINGKAAFRGDGLSKVFVSTFSRVAPATQPLWVCFVAKALTWALNTYLWHDGGATIYRSPNTSSVRANNGTNSSSVALADATYYRIFAQFTGSTSDSLRVGSPAASTGVSFGNSASQGNSALFGAPTPVGFSSVEIARAVCGLGTPTTQQKTDYDSLVLAPYYGAGLQL